MLSSALACLFVLVVGSSLSDAAMLRSNEFTNATTSSHTTMRTRALQPRQSTDADLLNELIALALPTINRAIQQFVPDPFDLNLAGTINAGSLDVAGCTLSTSFDYNWGGITGLSSISIESLEVEPGTESLSLGCPLSSWNAIFNMAIASSSIFSLNDLGAKWKANACGVGLSPTVGGDIITKNATMAGAVELSGDIVAGLLKINFAKILDSLQVDYSSVEASVDDVPPFLGSIITKVTTELSTLMKNDLINTVEPAIRPIIEEHLAQASTFAPAKVIPINLGLLRNAASRRVQSFVNGTSHFLLGLTGGGR